MPQHPQTHISSSGACICFLVLRLKNTSQVLEANWWSKKRESLLWLCNYCTTNSLTLDYFGFKRIARINLCLRLHFWLVTSCKRTKMVWKQQHLLSTFSPRLQGKINAVPQSNSKTLFESNDRMEANSPEMTAFDLLQILLETLTRMQQRSHAAGAGGAKPNTNV